MRHRSLAALASVATAAIASTVLTAAPAQAYSPNPRVIQHDSELTII